MEIIFYKINSPMFETSFLLCLKTLVANLILPLLTGIIFIRICFGKKIKGMILYILGWFIGVGVVAFSLFNLQLIHFGIGIKEYILILLTIIVILTIKVVIKKETIKEYLKTLRIRYIYPEIKQSFFSLSNTEKVFTILISLFGIGFLITTFIHTSNFPTYADDSFGNRNGPTYNIYQDGGVKLFGKESEILGRGRLGYPIYIPIYKAMISKFVGGFNDIYINIRQRLVFVGLLRFIFTITFQKTKNIFFSVLPIGLIIGLPLVFFHASEGYMELPCAAYSVITIRAFWKFLEEKDPSYITLGLLSGFILSYIKNDGFIVYLPAILITFIIIVLTEKEGEYKKYLISFLKKGYESLTSGFLFIFFFLPFLVIKNYYSLGFNQAAGAKSGMGISDKIHREVFSILGNIFTRTDNYNVSLIIISLILRIYIKKGKKMSHADKLLVYTPMVVLAILLGVFLLTENYVFALDQTTINRVFTIVIILFFSFSGYIFIKAGRD